VIVTAPVKWVDGLDGAKHLVLDVTAEPEPEPPAEDLTRGWSGPPTTPEQAAAMGVEWVESEAAAEPKRRGRPPKSTEETTEVAPTEE
jgi:AT hook motif.